MNKILDKIQKLLTLAKNKAATPAEAATAMATAQRLMAEHQITQLDLDGPVEEITRGAMCRVRQRHTQWKVYLADQIARVNGCRILVMRRSLSLFGRESDRQVVEYMFTYCVRQIDQLVKRYKGTVDLDTGVHCVGKDWANSFRWGCAQTIVTRMWAERRVVREAVVDRGEASSALVKVDQHEAAVAAVIAKRTRGSYSYGGVSNNGAYEQGQKAGATVALNKGMSGKGVRRLGS